MSDAARAPIVLVRHAETEWSLAGRHTGRTDIPLTDAGRRSALELAPSLSGYDVEAVLCSPLRRALETCDLCGLRARARITEDLLEWDYGEYEGLTSAQIQELSPGWRLWRDGCPAGESPADVGARADRVTAAIGELPGGAIVFSHGHMLRVLGARWAGLPPSGGGLLGLSTGGVCLLGHEHGERILERWNLDARVPAATA